MESIKAQMCECGCGLPAPVATRNWNKRGIKKGQYLRFICGHHRRGKEQSKEEKIKRVKSWGIHDCSISPYLPGNKVVRYNPQQKRWYCCHKTNSRKPHARMVYEHYFGKIPEDYVIHHKSGTADKLEDDSPSNLLAVPKIWNLHYFPKLASGFNVSEKLVTNCYIKVIAKTSKNIFKEVCRAIIEELDGNQR